MLLLGHPPMKIWAAVAFAFKIQKAYFGALESMSIASKNHLEHLKFNNCIRAQHLK